MQLNYKHEFAEALRNGTKIHTIRRKPVQPGTKLTHVIYPYDRDRRKVVLENTCTACQFFTLQVDNGYKIVASVDGRVMTPPQVTEILTNDGVKNILEAVRLLGLSFSGYIVHWTDKRY